jgi:hypothetical protein
MRMCACGFHEHIEVVFNLQKRRLSFIYKTNEVVFHKPKNEVVFHLQNNLGVFHTNVRKSVYLN